MTTQEQIRIVAARDCDVLPVAQVTLRAFLDRQWIYKTKEEWRHWRRTMKRYRVVTYKITEAGRKVVG